MYATAPNHKGYPRRVSTIQLFSSETISSGSSVTSDPVDVSGLVGDFGIQVDVGGDGTLKLEHLVSLDGANFLEPSGDSDIATDLTKTSGPGSDGKDIYSVSPGMPVKAIKIKATETGSANDATLSATMAAK
jgi:hypothetical protein